MDDMWEIDRIKLYFLRQAQPNWTLARLAEELGRSLSWVKKWLRRFREAGQLSVAMFKSRSRAPHRRPRQIVRQVRDAILDLRDQLKDQYGRVVGAKTILYHLHRDPLLKERGAYVPMSPRTIWQVLKDGGRIRSRVRNHHPIERPEPMRHWEMDFGQLGERFEFLAVVDRGTSILVDTQTQPHYKAESALMAVARLLIRDGLPEKLRFDNDPRFVGNWLADGFPSPLMRFLLCLGVEPDLVEPGKPYHKPFAERTIRTLKYESLAHIPPPDYLAAADRLTDYRAFFNHERAHQGLACGNRPPFEAFPTLPILPHVPEQVDPDAWLAHYHLQVFGRRVGRNGMIAVGRHNYYVGYAHAGARVSVILDAKGCVFRIVHRGTVICEKEIQGLVGHPLLFQDYLARMLLEARTTDPR